MIKKTQFNGEFSAEEVLMASSERIKNELGWKPF